MKKALLLGLGLSVCVGQAQAEPFTVVGRVLADLAPYAPAVKNAVGHAAITWVGVGLGFLLLEAYSRCTCWSALKEADYIVRSSIGGVVLGELMARTENDPAKAAALMYQYYNATRDESCESQACLLRAADELGYKIQNLASVGAGLAKEIPSLWRAASVKRSQELRAQLAELQAFLISVVNIIKSTDEYEQQLEANKQLQEKVRAERLQDREYEIRADQARATRKIIIHQDGHEEAVTA